MPDTSSRSGIKNRILSGLSRADFALLKPHLIPVDLPVEARLETGNSRIDYVYFLECLAVVLGEDRAVHDTYIQASGHGQRITAAKLRWAMDRSVRLHRSLLRCAHAFLIQTTQTALANGRSRNEERLARWLLMADDRIDRHELPLTHKFLGIMLGVQRPAVTVAMRALEEKGLISAGRGFITVIDRKGLERMSNGAYLPLE
jgi:hypothetical protein